MMNNDQFSDEETARRRDEVIRRMGNTLLRRLLPKGKSICLWSRIIPTPPSARRFRQGVL